MIRLLAYVSVIDFVYDMVISVIFSGKYSDVYAVQEAATAQ